MTVRDFDSPIGRLMLTSNDRGLVAVDWPSDIPTGHIGGNSSTASAFLDQASDELTAFFAGTLRRFETPLAPAGTPFQLTVWQALRRIPYGQTSTYGAIAKAMGNPNASRAVGAATGRNPIPIIIPCHRLVGSNGALTGFSGGLARKEFLLELENRLR